MPGIDVRLEIKGLKETQAKMEKAVKDLHGPPMLQAMRDATLLVQRDARINAPVDTGRLRSSIVPEVLTRDATLVGIIGTNVLYAPYVETGTDPHWPPPGALAVWAKRHNIPEFLVRRAIGTFGTSKRAFEKLGTKGWFYLKRALEDNAEKVKRIFDRAIGKILK